MSFTRIAAGAAVAAAALTATAWSAGPAAADPTGAKKGAVFTLECEDLGSVEVATNGNPLWPPTHIIGGTPVLVPYAFHIELTPTGGATQSMDIVKHEPKNATLDVCTFTDANPDGVLEGTAYVAVRPS